MNKEYVPNATSINIKRSSQTHILLDLSRICDVPTSCI